MKSRYADLVGKTIKSAEPDGYHDILTFDDGTVAEIAAYDGDVWVYTADEWAAALQRREERKNRPPPKFTEAIAESMRRNADKIAANVRESNSLLSALTPQDKSAG